MKPNYMQQVAAALARRKIPGRADGGPVEGLNYSPAGPNMSTPQSAPVNSSALEQSLYSGLAAQGYGAPPLQSTASASSVPSASTSLPSSLRGPNLIGAVNSVMNQPEPDVRQVSAGGVIPAHEMSRIGPKVQGAYDKAFADQENAISTGTNIMEGAALQEANAYESASKKMAERAEAEQKLAQEERARIEQKIEQERKNIDDMAKENAADVIDGNRFWASRSTGQKISSFIGVALGGFVSGATGRPNDAMDQINKMIDRDISQQLDAVNARRQMRGQKIGVAKTAIEQAQQRFASVDQQIAASKASAMEGIQFEIKKQLANNKSAEVQARGIEMLAGLEKQKADFTNQATQFVQKTYSEPMYRKSGELGAYTARQIDSLFRSEKAADKKFAADIALEGVKSGNTSEKQAQERAAATVITPTGLSVQIPDAQRRSKATDAIAAANNIQGIVKDILAMSGDSPTLSPQKRGQLSVMHENLRAAVSQAANMGIINSKADLERLERLSGGNIDDFLTLKGNLERVVDEANRRVDSIVRTTAGPNGEPAMPAAKPVGARPF